MSTPVTVWDVRESRWQQGPAEGRSAWLRAHGLPAGMLYRAEFYPGSPPSVRVFCYAPDDQGRRHWNENHIPGPHDHSACDAAREEPRDVPLDGLPPRELW